MATEKFQQSVSTFLALLPISYHITIMTFLPLGLRGLDTSQGNWSRSLSCHFKTQTQTESVVQLRIADCTLQLDQRIRSLSQTAGPEKGKCVFPALQSSSRIAQQAWSITVSSNSINNFLAVITVILHRSQKCLLCHFINWPRSRIS